MLGGLLVPTACMSCQEPMAEDGALCASCWQKMEWISEPFCPVMGTPFQYDLGMGTISAQAIAKPPSFDRARAIVLYNKKARELVSRLKYNDDMALAPWMAKWMTRAARQMIASKHSNNDDITGEKWQLIMPVPLHKHRLLSRRYNQAAELARHVADELQAAYDPLSLYRHRSTQSQVGLPRDARTKNVAGAFRIFPQRGASLQGKSILLIDDVYTTGATIEACSRALRRAGAQRIDVLTFARVSPMGFCEDF